MGACATKPKVLKDENSPATVPAPEPIKEESVQPVETKDEPVVVKEADETKPNSLGSLLDNEEKSNETKVETITLEEPKVKEEAAIVEAPKKVEEAIVDAPKEAPKKEEVIVEAKTMVEAEKQKKKEEEEEEEDEIIVLAEKKSEGAKKEEPIVKEVKTEAPIV
ncbi:FK506-binding protein 4 isoform X2 [Gossypium hirsutum]|uniref:FK506-binding protein 4 isoform X2 n=1 Tax=Gossypium hirsutum TaxID=3635 RepID=A0A1U8L434_GOSHI|nr:FK506-binding protein 4-like isoform X3 [Gossypium hirsutum]XP_040967607.1 FK506-binding protein 4-like isoform X2 [Gossypium hirsutum]